MTADEMSRAVPFAIAAPGDGSPSIRRELLKKRLRRLLRPALLGTLRKTAPISAQWGYDRGTPVDRFYIEAFLEKNRSDIRGRVLEVKDSGYTVRFGSHVEQRDVLDIEASNSSATVIADLAAADHVPSAMFDCFILTETLQYVYDARGAVEHARRILRPGGALLVTVPAVSRVTSESGLLADQWRFMPASCARLFGEVFGPENITIRSYGNILTSIAFLTGMACEELSHRELNVADPRYPLVISVRAVREGCAR